MPLESAWNHRHDALAVAGLVPGVGIVPDAVDTVLYGIEGDWGNTLIGIGAMIPVAGQGVRGLQYGAKYGDDVVGVSKNATKYQKHHWWPKELGGANRKGSLVDVPSANPNLHTKTGGIHPEMRKF